MGQVLRDIYEAKEIVLSEQKENSKAGVLGIVEGVFFLPNTPSRNGRIYPDSLWENVLKSDDVKRLLANRLMIGTVGHEDLDFDALIREQKVSHVVTQLRMDETGKGYGKAEILDTPVGRILYTLLKNGSKMSVSSKGWGEYKGTNEEGLNVVDESSFILERFDFVVDPGFLDAVPGLKKKYESVMGDLNKTKEGNRMEIVDVLIKEKMELQEKLNKVMDELKKVEKEKQDLSEKIKTMKERQLSIVSENNKKDKRLNVVAEKYIGVKEDDEIIKEMRMLSNLITEEADKLVKIGVDESTLKDTSLSSILAKVFLQKDNLTQLVVEAHNNLSERMDEEIDENNEQYKKAILKMKKSLREAKRILAVVDKLGGLKGIVESLLKARHILRYVTDKKILEETNKLSAVHGVGKTEVKALIERVGIKRADAMLKSGRNTVTESKVVVGEKRNRVFNESIASRVMGNVFSIDKK